MSKTLPGDFSAHRKVFGGRSRGLAAFLSQGGVWREREMGERRGGGGGH